MSMPRWVQLLLVVIIIGCGYYLLQGHEASSLQVAPDRELPQFSGHNVVDDSYDLDGVRSYRITSSYLDHYAGSGDTVFEDIVLYIFREGDTVEWEIVSDRAVLDNNEHLNLRGNVVATNLLPDASFERMTTDVMIIELASKDFHTDTQVTLEGPTFENMGQAAFGNFGKNEATLFNKVIGVYETTP